MPRYSAVSVLFVEGVLVWIGLGWSGKMVVIFDPTYVSRETSLKETSIFACGA